MNEYKEQLRNADYINNVLNNLEKCKDYGSCPEDLYYEAEYIRNIIKDIDFYSDTYSILSCVLSNISISYKHCDSDKYCIYKPSDTIAKLRVSFDTEDKKLTRLIALSTSAMVLGLVCNLLPVTGTMSLYANVMKFTVSYGAILVCAMIGLDSIYPMKFVDKLPKCIRDNIFMRKYTEIKVFGDIQTRNSLWLEELRNSDDTSIKQKAWRLSLVLGGIDTAYNHKDYLNCMVKVELLKNGYEVNV